MKINLVNLEEGLTEINFEHSSDSLDLAELEDIGDSFVNPVKVKVTINKIGAQYFLHGSIDTIAYFTCDRCLEKFNQKLNSEFELVYTTEKEYDFDSVDEEGFRLLPSDSNEIDITADIRESLLLMIPMKIICSEECHGLCPHCGINLNIKTCNCKSNQIDSRWEALKKLKGINSIEP